MSFRYEPPQVEQTVSVAPTQRGDRLVDKTVKHVAKGWIPINPSTLKVVKGKLAAGAYRTDTDEFINDIKLDPGLVVHCMRRLGTLVDIPKRESNPIQLLKQLEEEKLATLLSVEEADASMHRFEDATKHQALQLQATLLSTQAAEGMAPKASVDPDTAYTSSFLRQVGYALIAWNYPDIYNRLIVAHRSKGIDIEAELVKLLGVTPHQLAYLVAGQLNIAGASAAALTRRPEYSSDNPLPKICELADLFARSKDPQSYPEAQKNILERQAELNQFIPLELREKIEKRVATFLKEQTGLQALQELPLVKDLVRLNQEGPGATAFKLNAYAQRCAPALRKKFEEIYATADLSRVSLDALRELTNDLIPRLGFEFGCLYMHDGRTGALEPALRVGSKPLRSYALTSSSWHHVVASSIDNALPYKAEGIARDGSTSVYMCSGLGNKKFRGVLYLELHPLYVTNADHPSLLHFQAIRQAINDFLGPIT
ncbi:MAG: hypothetical protein K1X79_04130 [Oligoflexia bacterium]|nr:hypothetical protein [Oligoflexia bacterium]